MKVIIVGAGVSGLSTYLLLEQLLSSILEVEITIYDSYLPSSDEGSSGKEHGIVSDSVAVVGNSIILPPSTVRLLRKINERLYELFKSRGFENHAFTLRTAGGHTLARIPTDDGVGPSEHSISCPRWVLWECLQDVVGRQNLSQGKVTGLELKHGERPRVIFEDGRIEEADMVVGADGAHSSVRRALFCEDHGTEYAPRFEGYCGVGSFVDVDEMPEVISKNRSVVVTFGPLGSFGYAAAAPLAQRMIGWWSNWPTEQLPESSYSDPEEVRRQLLARHGTWTDPIIQQCISCSTTDRVYPLWTTPDLPHWGNQGCVLLGDAAHTLQATSGQGAAQAIEDSVTFVLLLKRYIERERLLATDAQTQFTSAALLASVDAASKGLYALRHKRVASIRQQARNLYVDKRTSSNLFREYCHYCFIFMVTRFPGLSKWTIGNSFKELQEWWPETEVERFLALRSSGIRSSTEGP